VWPSRGQYGMTPPACNNPTAQTFMATVVDSACTNRLPSSLSLSALFGRVNLTFNLLASNLVHIITRLVGKRPTNFGVSRTLRSRLIGQHLSDATRDLATFDLAGHGFFR